MMKYWGYFFGKVVAGAGLVAAVWPLFKKILPAPQPYVVYAGLNPMGHDLGYSAAVYGFWLLVLGLFSLIVLDQKYRCRTCLRKLRMPISRGSWNHMLLLGRPHTEYICPYGHGTLKVPEFQITGKEPIDWAENQDMWKELELLHTDKR
jgi:hypothetical protein